MSNLVYLCAINVFCADNAFCADNIPMRVNVSL